MSASPIPERFVVKLSRRRSEETAFYVVQRWHRDWLLPAPDASVELVAQMWEIRGGPFGTRADAQAAIDAWHRELDDLYDAVEERARRDGVTVAW